MPGYVPLCKRKSIMLIDTPLISIITLNWNTTDITCDFLYSIGERNSYKNIEVIVVDNASREDPTAAFLAAVLPARVAARLEPMRSV